VLEVVDSMLVDAVVDSLLSEVDSALLALLRVEIDVLVDSLELVLVEEEVLLCVVEELDVVIVDWVGEMDPEMVVSEEAS
jgi:hypothetical protein